MFRRVRAMLAVLLFCCFLVNVVYAAKVYRLSSGEVLNDPTLPAGWRAHQKPNAKAKTFKLNYILNADKRKQAMVNGKKVRVGDTVAGAKVIQIQKDAVTLLVDGNSRVLRMNKRFGIKQAK